MIRTMKDRTGKIYGRVRIVGFSHKEKGRQIWNGICTCGKKRGFDINALENGMTRSCGCLSMERKKSGLNQMVHGDARVGHVSRLHNIWRGILKRCSAKNSPAYLNYGGRGISICDAWRDYRNFKKWSAANGYDDSKSIDRINNDGDYEAGNCRWVDKKTQARNRRSSRLIEIDGIVRCLQEWSDMAGVCCGTISHRIKRGWTNRDAVFKRPYSKMGNGRMITFGSKEMCVSQWAKTLNMGTTTFANRIDKWGICERVFKAPVMYHHPAQ